MHKLSFTIAALALAGCAGSGPGGPTTASAPIMSPAPAPVAQPPKSDLWEVGCTNDNHGTAPRKCTLTKMDKGGYMTVLFVNRQGPFLTVGSPTYPGRPNPARVDDKPVRDAAKSGPTLIAEALRGKILYGSFTMWPGGETLNAEIDLAGFPEAYAKLKAAALQRS